jgi:hypothetical protein
MIVQVYDRFKSHIKTPIKLTVERFTFDIEQGGPAQCTIRADGQRETLAGMREWLGGYVKVFNDNLTPVWWGKLDSVTTFIDGQRRVFTLSDMRNRIRALYTFTDGDGVSFPLATDWAEDADSIMHYGIFEEQRSVGESTEELAEAARDSALAWLAKPGESFGIVRQTNGGSLRCTSLWSTLDQTYAVRDNGREVYMGETTTEQKFGWGFTSAAIGFADKGMHAVDGGLEFLDEGDRFVISGSTDNDSIKDVFLPVEGKFESYAYGDVAFNGIDDIDQPSERLGFIRKSTFIHITGSDFNDGYHLIDNPGRNHVTTDQNVTGDILTENGLPVTIKQGETIWVGGDVTNEIPGATITIKQVGEKIFYTFTVTSVATWTVAEIWVRMRREGTPVDSVNCELYTAPAGVITTLLETSTILGSLVPKKSTWFKFPFTNVDTMIPGDTYAIVMSRTGSLSNTDFYYIDIDETEGHGGNMGLWNGTTWEGRPQGNASVPFQVWGHKRTTEQIYNMIETNEQYFSGFEVNATSTIFTRQYRDGTSLVDYELELLLNPGAESVRLLPYVTPEWRLQINPIPSMADVRYMLRGRQLLNRNGHPLEDGVLPVGEWCIVEGETDRQAFLIGYLEYDPDNKQITDIRAIDAPDPWSVMTRQG